MLNGHGGNIYELARTIGRKPSEIIDMSSNVNPLGPPPGFFECLTGRLREITTLPEADAKSAALAFTERYGLMPGRVLAGSGTTQFIYSSPVALGTKKALILGPTYADYADACAMHNTSFEYLFSTEADGFRPDIGRLQKNIAPFDTIFICNPNNPTGALIPAAELEPVCWAHPDKYFIIDESYMPFVGKAEDASMLSSGLSNVIVLNSMSKVFGIPGLRIGFLVANEKIVENFLRLYLPWSMNSMAQAAVDWLMRDKRGIDAFVEQTVDYLETEKSMFVKAFETTPEIRMFPSRTSFVLAALNRHTSAEILEELAKDLILIRDCANFNGLSDRFVRFSIRKKEHNRLLAERLGKIMG